ncbi:uncharacterized protein LOC116060324 isoform X2 [Sander lucioperca]|uniref:uncharacterized protein LOC116060324 isoform X2 n=1 Tax=Sander lucioperca TaxID=283035 RepID=UPI00125E95F5|nr:uncharacterized protein LOC116060324 isoform X2 [Sander lucioperca]
MTHPTDFSYHPLPKSGQSQHTQESGDAGLSSNMKHKFSDHYNERALPVADEGIFGKPTPNEEVGLDIVTAMKAKIWSHPNNAGPKAEGHPVSAEGGFSKPSTLNNFPPDTLSKNSPQEETVLPGRTAITEGQQDTEVAGEESCKMDTGKNPKPKGPPLVPGKGRNHCRKSAAGKYWKMYLLCWWSLHVPVSNGFSGAQLAADHKVKCFTCMDKDRCLKLMTIYDSDHDIILYKRHLNQMFSGCSVISPTGPKSCDVCIHQFKIIILCPEDVGKLDVEASNGEQIINISSVCDQNQTLGRTPDGLIVSGGDQTPDRACYGLIVSGALLLATVAMLVVYSD